VTGCRFLSGSRSPWSRCDWSRLGTSRLVPVPESEILPQRASSWDPECRKRVLHADPYGPSGIRLPGSLHVVAMPLAKVYRCTRDVFWKILRHCSNIWNKSIFPELFPILFIQTLYVYKFISNWSTNFLIADGRRALITYSKRANDTAELCLLAVDLFLWLHSTNH
jgi:hypothetical protein